MRAEQVLDAVESWAHGAFLIRETGALRNGRMDGILIPYLYECSLDFGIWGVEVKVSRSDFLAGLRKGQYERYEADVDGLFVATPRGVCKTSELPKKCGHLVIGPNPRIPRTRHCICRRRPKTKHTPLDDGACRRLLFAMGRQFFQSEWASWREVRDAKREVGRAGAAIIGDLLKRVVD